jgi:hypothetical protein
MYTREAVRKLGWSNGAACAYATPAMPSAEGLRELARLLYTDCRGEDFQERSRQFRIRSGGVGWERMDVLRSLDVVLARVALQICDGDTDLMMHFNALRELYTALAGLDEGDVAAMLKPRGLNHRPPASRTQMAVKHILVASYSALRRLGLTREDAARDVVALLRRRDAVALREAQRLLGGERVTKSIVYRWWRKFRNDSMCQGLAQTDFHSSAGGQSRHRILTQTEAVICRLLRLDVVTASSS